VACRPTRTQPRAALRGARPVVLRGIRGVLADAGDCRISARAGRSTRCSSLSGASASVDHRASPGAPSCTFNSLNCAGRSPRVRGVVRLAVAKGDFEGSSPRARARRNARIGRGPSPPLRGRSNRLGSTRAIDGTGRARGGLGGGLSFRAAPVRFLLHANRLVCGRRYSFLPGESTMPNRFSSPLGESSSSVRTGARHPDCRSTSGEASARSFRPSASTTLRTVSKFGTRSPDSAL